jgi:hypothetical protein
MCSKVWCVTCDSVQKQNIVCKLGLEILNIYFSMPPIY